MGGKTVLLRYDDATGGWFRVEPRSAVVAGRAPAVAARVSAEDHARLGHASRYLGRHAGRDDTGDAAGGPAEARADVPLIEVVYGRVVLINTTDAKSSAAEAGAECGRSAARAERDAGVEVERQYVPGNDPRKTPAPVVVRMFAPEGGVRWNDAAGEIVDRQALALDAR